MAVKAWRAAAWAADARARFCIPLYATAVIAAKIAITTMTMSSSTIVKLRF
jgi:hypothetical protein